MHRSTLLSPASIPAGHAYDAGPRVLTQSVWRPLYAEAVLRDRDLAYEQLAAVEDADELCRHLLATSLPRSSTTRHMEGVELLARVSGTGKLPRSFVALLLCSCRRWDRVSGRLVAAVEDSRLLDDADLDELAESFLLHECVISYPLAWMSPQWLDVDLGDGTSSSHIVDEDTLGQHHPSCQPPLRRWAARRALRADPIRFDDLLQRASAFAPRHRDALVHGLLDAADTLDETERRNLIERGLRTAQTSVRKAALDRLCELDGPAPALHRARADPNASVRNWRPQHAELMTTPSLVTI